MVAYILINCTSTEEQGYALDRRYILHRSLFAQIPNGQGNVRALLVTMTPITLIIVTANLTSAKSHLCMVSEILNARTVSPLLVGCC